MKATPDKLSLAACRELEGRRKPIPARSQSLTATGALALFLILSSWATAQGGLNDGILPFSTHEWGIDLASSAIYVDFPLRSKAGKIPYSSSLNESNYYSAFVNSLHQYVWMPWGSLAFHDTAIQPAALGGTVGGNHACPNGIEAQYTSYSAAWITDGTGAQHTLNDQVVWNRSSNASCQALVQNQSVGSGVTDGTGWSLSVPATGNPVVYDVVGHQYTLPISGGLAYLFTDPDGATISWNTSDAPEEGGSATDSLGTTVLTLVGSATGGTPTSASYTDASGNTQTYTITYNNSLPLASNFGCSGIGESGGEGEEPTSIETPTGASYTISYEPTPGKSGYYTGRVAKITLPSGGSISYAYSGGNNGIYCPTTIGGPAYVPTITVTVNDNNGNSGVYTYVHSSPSASTTTVTRTDPAGNQTVYTFSGEFQTEVQYYQGSATGTPLMTVSTVYNENSTGTIALPITETDVYTSLNGSSSSRVITTYDTHSNVTSVLTYDFGGALLSSAYNYYGQSWNGTSCTAYAQGTAGGYIYNTPCYGYITNSAGTTVSKTQITYSNTGHPTSNARWVSGSTWLTSTATYNSNGTLATATDSDGAVTTYAYNGTGGCNNLLLTSVTYPLSSVGSSSQTWNCAGGVLSTSTDPNSAVTSYAYSDPLWRQTAITYPDKGATTTAYNTGSSFPWSITTNNLIVSGTNRTTVTQYDGLGRLTLTELTSDPGGTDYAATTYNSLGQVASVSQPYYAGATVYATQYTYDALGRLTHIATPNGFNKYFSYSGRATQLQQYPYYDNQITISQMNGLGLIAAVCEVTSQTQMGSTGTPAACGLDISGTGFLTTYSYDPLGNLIGVSNASNNRGFAYDGLSRLTQAVEPELYLNAVNYTYDTQMAGDLYQRTAPAPNQTGSATVTTTYTHDKMHRLTQINYSDGTTPSVTLAYDQTSNWGETLANPKGRLTGRFTCSPGTSCGNTSSASAGLTGDVFSYDSMGRPLFDYQCTPSLCGTQHLPGAYTYNLLGQIATSNDVQGGVTFTNTYNAAARLTQIYSSYLSSTQAGDVVSGIVYNAAGQPMSDLLGNGIQEAWAYDAANNQSAYSAGAYSNSTSWVGNDLVVSSTDTVNGTWTYSNDNFGRLSSSSCSSSNSTCPGKQSSVGFNYVYDQLGNRWQQNLTAGSGPAPQHTFGPWNHINDGSVAYDVAGNVINDGFHTYAYDAEGRVTKVDGGATAFLAYNAAGFRVEQGVNSTDSVEYLYDLGGNEVSALVPGTTNLFTTELFDNGRHWVTFNGEAQFLHADWLGNVRAVTNLSGSTNQQCTSLPFGDDLSCTSSITAYTGITGTFFDSYDNLDHFPYRQYTSNKGVWLTPDPAGLAAANPAFPQSWNRYAYVNNNAVSQTDPTGLGPPLQTLINNLMGAKCNAFNSSDIGPSGATPGPCSMFVNMTCVVDGLEEPCNLAMNLLQNDEFEAMNIPLVGENLFNIPGHATWVPNPNYDPNDPDSMAGTFVTSASWVQVGTGLDVMPDAANNSSWGWNFTKAFFGGLVSSAGWKAVYHSFGEGGCDNLMLSTLADTLNPLPGGGVGASDVAESAPNAVAGAGQAAASAYSVYQGLSVPLRSSIYRGLQSSTYGYAGAVAEAVPYALVGYAGGKALYTAGTAAYNGECH